MLYARCKCCHAFAWRAVYGTGAALWRAQLLARAGRAGARRGRVRVGRRRPALLRLPVGLLRGQPGALPPQGAPALCFCASTLPRPPTSGEASPAGNGSMHLHRFQMCHTVARLLRPALLACSCQARRNDPLCMCRGCAGCCLGVCRGCCLPRHVEGTGEACSVHHEGRLAQAYEDEPGGEAVACLLARFAQPWCS